MNSEQHPQQSTTILRHAQSDEDILACFPVMQELRPNITSAQELLERVTRQREQGYKLWAIWRGVVPIALAGYRVQENLVHGRFLYVDDLVTLSTERGGQLGKRLLDTITIKGRELDCTKIILDTGLANSLAQRFYFRQGMLSSAMRFYLDLSK